jgi:hypothetical protein
MLGIEGKKIDIIPTTRGLNATELYTKKDMDYIGLIAYCPEWKEYVLVDVDKNMQLSKSCIDEAFQMVNDYWKDKEMQMPDSESPQEGKT